MGKAAVLIRFAEPGRAALATAENGPLRVIPGSHRTGKKIVADDVEPVTIFAQRGDALAMRPLVAHSSGDSLPGTQLHRRILHLEFAAREELPDGYEWQQFLRDP